LDPIRPDPLSAEKSGPDPTRLNPIRPVDGPDPRPTLIKNVCTMLHFVNYGILLSSLVVVVVVVAVKNRSSVESVENYAPCEAVTTEG